MAPIQLSDPAKDQALKLFISFWNAGFTESEIDAVIRNPLLIRDFKNVLRGYSKVRSLTHVIDCDADPLRLDHYEVVRHQKGGRLIWDPSDLDLYRSPQQDDKQGIIGTQLLQELEGKPVLNANVLDYIITNQIIIPEKWEEEGKGSKGLLEICFWGTLYRIPPSRNLVVRTLCRETKGWRPSFRIVHACSKFFHDHPAVLYVNPWK